MGKNGLDFIFFFFVDDVRWWLLEVRTVYISFAIGG
jgi:hypothetical protein